MVHPAFKRLDHRPWPAPQSAWKGRQSWRDLLFAHWPVPSDILQPLVPEPLDIQEYDGTSWVGIVPFRLEDLMLRSLPALPWVSAFPELNLRLYVSYDDKPGVWFLSLDATNPLAVQAARRLFYLPYFNAEIEVKNHLRQIHYSSSRKNQKMAADFEAVYEPVSEPYEAEAGSLEHWLTERYCLYSQSPAGTIYRVEIHHLPWLLQKAKAEIIKNELPDPFNIPLPDTPPLLHFVSRQDMVQWLPEKIAY